jgi:sialic acid synthase SpsE
MKAGDVITEDSIRSVRPGFGLAPKEYKKFIGQRINSSVNFGSPVKWNLIGVI